MSAADGDRKVPPGAPDEATASEFLSETSEEYRAIRRSQPRSVPPPVRPPAATSPWPDTGPTTVVSIRPIQPRDAAPSAEQTPSGPTVPAAIGVPLVHVPKGPASQPTDGAGRRPGPADGAGSRPVDRAALSATLRAAAGAPSEPIPTSVTPVASPKVPARRAVPWGWLIVTIAAAVGAAAWPLVRSEPSGTVAGAAASIVMGAATIASRPAGADVWIDGERRGVTPLTINLRAGLHKVEVRNGDAVRQLTLEIAPNVVVRETIDLVPTLGTGSIEVTTDVPGAQVSVDGVPRGVTPLVVHDLTPAAHTVTVSAGGTVVTRSVTVPAGGTAAVVASVAPGAAAGGFLTVRAPFEMQVLERGRVVGTTSAERLMLPAGARQLELVAEAYEFRTTIAANIQPGRTTTVPVSVPNGRLSINAVPWAEVWLDGAPLGATPLANVEVPAGAHEIVWRHPQLGERRQTVRVPTSTPARASVDLTVASQTP